MQVSIDEKLHKRAKKAARRQGISLAELCRRSLEEFLARQPDDKPWMAFAGIFEGREGDSESVDERGAPA